MAGLALFMLLYFALAGQFLYTAWRLTFGAEPGGSNAFFGWLVGGAALFLAVFMLKGLTSSGTLRFLRLAAASEGASAELLAQARALPATEGWDASSLWVSYAAGAGLDEHETDPGGAERSGALKPRYTQARRQALAAAS